MPLGTLARPRHAAERARRSPSARGRAQRHRRDGRSSARRVFPQIRPRGFRDAIRRALSSEDREFAATHWSDSMSSGVPSRKLARRAVRRAARRLASRAAGRHRRQAFAPVARLAARPAGTTRTRSGACAGWSISSLAASACDRGRRHPEQLHPGDSLDFWRVEAVEPNRLLRLHAEMRLPGRAWLQFEVTRRRSRRAPPDGHLRSDWHSGCCTGTPSIRSTR